MRLRAAIKRLPFAEHVYGLIRLSLGRNRRFAADYTRNSGVGSDLEATKAISESLPRLVSSLSVRSVLDIPCGDFVWMRHVDLGDAAYTGADVIEELVQSHQARYGSDRRHFETLDIVTSPLPQVDLVLCRDCLVHFSDRLVRKAVMNIKRSGSTYLLTTTFPRRATNGAVVTGNWRPINLCAPPFGFPPPLELLDERHPAPYQDKALGLWKVESLPTY